MKYTYRILMLLGILISIIILDPYVTAQLTPREQLLALQDESVNLCEKAIVQYRSECVSEVQRQKDEFIIEIHNEIRKQKGVLFGGVFLASLIGSFGGLFLYKLTSEAFGNKK